MTNSKRRIDWIDISRGIAFMMVIYSHLEYANSTVMHYFGPVFLTVFFFVSGYLYKSGESFSKIVEHRTRTLLIPLILLSLVNILLSQIVSFKDNHNWANEILGVIFQNNRYPTTMWFVAALYVYSLFFYFVDKYCTTIKSLLIVGLGLYLINTVTYYYLGFTEHQSFWYIHTLGFSLFYMALGRAFRRGEHYFSKAFSIPALSCAIIIYICLVFFLDRYISCGGSRYVIDSLAITLLGLYIIVGISRRINNVPGKSLVIFVGANSLLYFAFHGKVYSVLQNLLHKGFSAFNINYSIGEIASLDFIIAIMLTLLDAVILICPIILMNRHIPWISGKGYKIWQSK